MKKLALALLSSSMLAACASGGGGAGESSPEAAAVEAAVRALLQGYGSAQDGTQAEAAIALFSTAGHVDRLKAQAGACRTAAQSGGEVPASCAKDPIFCGEEPAPVAGVSVKNVSAGVASAEVGITQPSGAVTALVSLAKVGDAWKVDSITCPQ